MSEMNWQMNIWKLLDQPVSLISEMGSTTGASFTGVTTIVTVQDIQAWCASNAVNSTTSYPDQFAAAVKFTVPSEYMATKTQLPSLSHSATYWSSESSMS